MVLNLVIELVKTRPYHMHKWLVLYDAAAPTPSAVDEYSKDWSTGTQFVH